jgi:hypothetical protein
LARGLCDEIWHSIGATRISEAIEIRIGLAGAGQRRCVESGYFETDRVREILPALEALCRASSRDPSYPSLPNSPWPGAVPGSPSRIRA